MNQHHDTFLLGGIAAVIRWIEDLINLLSGPLLTIGLGIALVALLTDGQLLASVPLLLYIWAISQALGVDAQLVSTWDRARMALRERCYWSLVGLVILGGVLAYVAWVAAQVFALQESQGIPTAQALNLLGMDSSSWLVQRTALQVFLVALAGWTRYHKPTRDYADEKAELEAELELEPLRNRRRALQARGVRGAWDSLRGKTDMTPSSANTSGGTISSGQLTGERPAPDASTQADGASPAEVPSHDAPERPPTGPGSPAKKRGVRNPRKKPAKVVRLRNGSAEERAAAAWVAGMSIPALEKAAGISRATAQKYHAKFSAAQQSGQAAQ